MLTMSNHCILFQFFLGAADAATVAAIASAAADDVA